VHALLQCRGGRGRPGGPKAGWVGWLLGRLGQKSKEISFCNKNWIFEYSKALEICIRRFRMDFDVGIFFLNSSRLLKDFRKIKYAMPCKASYARLFLGGFSYAQQIDMQPICTSILVKFYYCKMWVLHLGVNGVI
jgi:hypothetical protein